MSYRIRFVAVSALLACTAMCAQAASIVRANTAIASSEFTNGFDGRAINTINGSGLPSPACPSAEHAAYGSGNHWTTTGGSPVGRFITWGFNTPQVLDAIHIWNHRSTQPPAANPFYDVTLFDLEVRNSANAIIYTITDEPMLPDTAAAQTFTFNSFLSDVKTVRFTIKQAQGTTNFTGLAEVLFNSPLPDPADLNADGMVDTVDLVRFLGQFGRTVTPGAPADFNVDGTVDTADLVFFLGRFGQTGC